MIDTGSIIISHETGWACAKECVYDMELDRLPDGRMLGSVVFFPKGMFDCIGKAVNGTVIKGIFIGDKGAKLSFNGKIQGDNYRILVQGELGNDFNQVLKEIKGKFIN